METDFIRQKIAALFKKHSADGTTPRKLVEANMARELRFSKDEIQKMLQDMNLEQKVIIKKHAKHEEPAQYDRKNSDEYLNDLKQFH